MNTLKKIIGQILIIALTVFGICGCAFAGSSSYDTISEIITDYAYYRDDASDAIESLFAELNETDAVKAEAWRKIYDYWKYANNEMQINTDQIPVGLPEDDSLCIVVLGYALMPDGSMKPELEGRLSAALQCAALYPNAFILCTGGGTASENKNATEAGVMAYWLTAHGIAADRIITENQSLTTGQNAVFSYKILSEQYPQINSLVIVSSDYHIPWGSVLFQAECILESENGTEPVIGVIANAAYKTDRSASDYLSSQASGLLEILDYSDAQ